MMEKKLMVKNYCTLMYWLTSVHIENVFHHVIACKCVHTPAGRFDKVHNRSTHHDDMMV